MTRRAALLAPRVGAALAAATVAVGLALDARGEVLGVPHPPFNLRWDPTARLGWTLAAAALFAAAALRLAPRMLDRRLSPLGFAAALFALTLALRLVLAFARGGGDVWSRIFDLERSPNAANEYLAALPATAHGAWFLLDRFAELVPALPVHAGGHPPGLLLTIHLLHVDTPERLAALCILGGALAAPLTYGLGRTLLTEPAARAGALLAALSPGLLMFGVTSADALYVTLGLLAAWSLAGDSRAVRAVGALVLGAAVLFAWSLLAIAAWAVLLALLRRGPRRALETVALAAAGVLAIQALLAVWQGWDPIATIRATEEVYRLGIASTRPGWFWLFGSPVAFLVGLGLPIAWLALRGLAERAPAAVAVFSVLAVAAALGLTKGETERIWQFFGPLVCLAAAPALARRPDRVAAVAVALAAQALLAELLLGSPW